MILLGCLRQKGYEKVTADLKKKLAQLIDQYEDEEAKKILVIH
jgi:hypothetical protein